MAFEFRRPLGGRYIVTVLVVFDGVRCVRTARPAFPLARSNRWYAYMLAIAGAAADYFLVGSPARAFVIEAYCKANTIYSSSDPDTQPPLESRPQETQLTESG